MEEEEKEEEEEEEGVRWTRMRRSRTGRKMIFWYILHEPLQRRENTRG